MMFRRSLTANVVVAAVTAAAIGTACSSSSPASTCPPPYSHATFRLTVEADSAPLPHNVVITVKYGSGEEVYDAEHPNQSPQVVFCGQVQADGGAIDEDASDQDASQPSAAGAIVCDLWTDGAATVMVTAPGYADTQQDLKADSDECGLKLTLATITLEQSD
jgi:hypothetical protein